MPSTHCLKFCRYLYGYLLAFRPILLHRTSRQGYINTTRQRSGEEPTLASILSQALVEHGLATCITTAKELVMLLQWVHQVYREAIPEPWYVIFYLYTCGMVLLLDRHSSISGEDGLLSWDTCLRTLRFYESTHRTAFRCVKLLELSNKSFFPATRSQKSSQTLTGPQFQSTLVSQNPAYLQPDDINSGSSFATGDARYLPNQAHESGGQGDVHEEVPSLWLEELDLAWLGTLPFVSLLCCRTPVPI